MKLKAFAPKGPLAIHPESVGLSWPQAPRSSETIGGVFVMQICGPLEHRASPWFDSYESILSRFEGAMCDDDVTAVILQIDSPGGEVSGLQETVKKMRAIKEEYGKPVCTYADDEAYSAAYAIACVADDIYLPEGGGVGSVGVIATICDRTKMTKAAGLRVEVVRSGSLKADGHPDIPLDRGVLTRLQTRVDDLAEQFFDAVSESRGISTKKIRSLEGACIFGQESVDVGLADFVSSFDEVLGALIQTEFDEGGRDVLSSSRGNSSPQGGAMKVLEKRVQTAMKALAEATGPKARQAAAKVLASAQGALIEAKMKKKYKKVTEETESEEKSEDDEEKAEEEEAEEESSEESTDSDDDGDDDDDDGDDDDDADEEDEEDSKSAARKVGKIAAQSIVAAAMRATKQKSVGGVMGALTNFRVLLKSQAALTKQVAKLQSESRSIKVDAMLAKAPPGMRKQLRAVGMKDPEALKGIIATMPKTVREEAYVPAGGAPTGPVGASAEQAQILQSIAAATGKTVEDLAVDMAKRVNGASKTPSF